MRILLLHALPLDERMWAPQLDVLADREVVAPNLYALDGSSMDAWATAHGPHFQQTGRLESGRHRPLAVPARAAHSIAMSTNCLLLLISYFRGDFSALPYLVEITFFTSAGTRGFTWPSSSSTST